MTSEGSPYLYSRYCLEGREPGKLSAHSERYYRLHMYMRKCGCTRSIGWVHRRTTMYLLLGASPRNPSHTLLKTSPAAIPSLLITSTHQPTPANPSPRHLEQTFVLAVCRNSVLSSLCTEPRQGILMLGLAASPTSTAHNSLTGHLHTSAGTA